MKELGRCGRLHREHHLRTPFPPEGANRSVAYTLDCCPNYSGLGYGR